MTLFLSIICSVIAVVCYFLLIIFQANTVIVYIRQASTGLSFFLLAFFLIDYLTLKKSSFYYKNLNPNKRLIIFIFICLAFIGTIISFLLYFKIIGIHK